ncbi:hypothetical protein Glove_460g67 [Diversispora epigaea]|uniref:Uncharacterized protein n=1 Tax=Diversispora epigaea TaxID=1348612 RepID=A0A397GPX1_9GLOM|nr:hypothetical protein Glove_460g67 [Diversispora epigaea]
MNKNSSDEDFDYNDFNDEIENEKIFKYNEELFELLINKDIDEDSDLDSEYDIEEDNNNDDQLEINEINNECEIPKIILKETDITDKNKTPCVIVNYKDGKIQTCGSTNKLRRLRNMIGSWQIDKDIVNNINDDYLKLGCINHSWIFNGCNLFVPCNGQFSCKALKNYPPLCYQISDENKIIRPRYLCLECYQKNGSYIHVRHGKGRKLSNCLQDGLHKTDASNGLETIVNCLLRISKGEDEHIKNLIFNRVSNVITIHVPKIDFGFLRYFDFLRFMQNLFYIWK